MGYSPWGHNESDMTEHAHTYSIFLEFFNNYYHNFIISIINFNNFSTNFNN